MNKINVTFSKIDYEETLDSIKQSEMHPSTNGLKYAMMIAVAGKHNILAYGAPGCGKTMILSRISEILPELSAEEFESVKRIYTLAGYDKFESHARKIRMPHQTATIEGVCGGGIHCRPGEISLAHNGVLFLDEAAEFRTSVLQMLRVPLENKTITLSRAGHATVYPADFQLIMSANPCPCGNFGNKNRICLCSARSIEQYWKKFSAPLLDRITIKFNCNETSDAPDYSLNEMRSMIKSAWEKQIERQGKLNNDLNSLEINSFVKLSDDAQNFLEETASKNNLSIRSLMNVKKLAQTLSDIYSDNETVSLIYVDKALKLFNSVPIQL